jgi:uncharacterized delta-60 repeat protein/uncharacterized repeat protein (TIGR02059 family)
MLVVCAICSSVPVKHAEAHSGIVSAPASCGALDSTNLNTHSYNQIYNRTSISSASTSKNIFSTKVNSTSTPWVRNTDIWSSKGATPIDWTGVAAYVYNSSNPNYFPSSRIATLISPRHFLAASHWQPNPGEILSFIDAEGNQVLRTVVAHQYLGNDLTVGVLDADVPSTITYYPLIASSTLAAKTQTLEPGDMDLTIVAFNQTPRLVVRDVYSILNVYNQTSHFPYTSGPFSQFSQDTIGGDSGSPAFILIDGKPVLLTAYTGPGGGPAYGNYISQINSAMTALGGGYQVTQYDASCFSNKVLNYAPAMSVSDMSATTTVHQASSTIIATLTATDPDSDTLQFSLGAFTSVASTTLSLNSNDYFSINSSGELRQIQDLDPDTQGYSLRLSVHVSDVDPTPGTSTTYITLNVDRMETTSILTADSVIEITYDKTVATSSVPSTSDFAVTVNGSARAVTSVSVVANKVILGLASPVAVGQIVRVTYTPGANPIKDYPSLAKAPSLDNVLVANSVAGSINTNFVSGNGINGTPSQILGLFLDSNNKILVGGSSLITSYSASSSVNKSILRLNSDGTIDTSFNYRGDLTVWRQGGIKQQADGKYIIVGNNISNYTSLGIERVNYDGSVDSTFTGQWDFDCNSTAVVIQNDGKIVSGSGCEQTYTGTTQKALARILSNGNLDTTFNSGGAGLDDGSFALRVEDLVLQPDQKILVAGEFGSYNGTTRYDLLRLNSDGTLDTSFNHSLPLTGIQTTVADIELLSNGQMYVSLLNSATTTPAVYRLNADGSTDTTFISKNFRKISGTTQGVNVYSVKQASDGKIIVAGNFERYDNQIANGLVRILSNGDVDGTFVTSGGLGSTTVGFSEYFIYSAQILPDGNLVAVGTFPTYDGVTKNNIVGVLTQTTSDATQPRVSNITSSVSNGTYVVGDTIPVQVTFSEPVIIVGSNPTLSLNASSTTVRTATYTSGSGSSTLTFSYVVQSGDVSNDLDYIDAASLNIIGGNLEDAAGNHAILTLPTPGQAGSLSANKNILVDGIVPVPYTAVASGNVLTLVLDSVVSTTSVPSAGAFVVRINGNTGYTSPTTVSIDNFAQITLGLSVAVQQGQNITISYSPSGSPLRDSNGNTVVAFSDFSVTNNTPASNAVVVQSGSAGYASGGGGGGGSASVNIIYPTKQNNVNNILVSTSTKLDTLAKINNSLSTSSPIQLVKNNREVCEPYIVDAMRFGAQNNASEVIKLQKFLNEFEGEKIFVNGVYDTSTLQAVMRFQQKYSKHILSPWGLSRPTGVVSQTTRAKINALVCGKIYGCPFFTEYYRFGNSGSEVDAIKSFLNLLNPSGNLNVSSENYDMKTRREIINFQNRYKDTVLKPWGLKSATSNWYKTSVASANEIMGCE